MVHACNVKCDISRMSYFLYGIPFRLIKYHRDFLKMDNTKKCELCGSSSDTLNFHHFIPKILHSTKWFEKRYTKEYMRNHGIWICNLFCHKEIHKFISSEKEMGRRYNTLELLMSHPDVKNYIEWRIKRIL